jgi:DNA-binding SARP family transcriptional activator
MVGLRVILFGGFEARIGSGASVWLPMKKAQALLAYLSLRPGQSHPRDKLASLLWGQVSEHHARGGLRQAVLALRKALADVHPPCLHVDAQSLTLSAKGLEVDVVAFERLIAEETTEPLEQAVQLYRGDLLFGCQVNEPLFEEWLVGERERLRELALEALARLLAQYTRSGGTERAIRTAVRLLALDPLQEAVHRTLMGLYSRQGRRAAALKQYQACVGALQRELGLEPEAETRQLYQDLLRSPTRAPKASGAREERQAARRPVVPPPPDFPAAETPMFGRHAELERLRQLLQEAVSGRGRTATVVGEAGIGKTRLASVLAVEALSLGCRVVVGRCHDSDAILPFGPWVDALRNGEIGKDEETLGRLHPLRRAELTRLLPEASVAGLPPPTGTATALFEGVASLVENVAARQPLVLILENLHWADEMSLRLLAFVSRRITTWRMLLLVTARQEELADASMARRTLEELARAPEATAVVVSPLSRPDIALLIRALGGAGSAALEEMEDGIWAMSEGNPFVAVEAVRSLRQTAGSGTDSGTPDLPASVRDLVGSRLDRLSDRSQQLAAVASVVGRGFPFALLRSASGLDERDVAESVEEMVRRHVLQAVGDQLDFTHERVRDVAYRRLLGPRRRLLHRAVTEALEADAAPRGGADVHAGGSVVEQVEQLAHHALHGGLGEKAAAYLRQAGDKAATRSALREAHAWLQKALDVLQTLPPTRSMLEEAFEVRLALRPVLAQLGEVRQVLQVLREAEALAEQLDDEGRRGRVCAFMTNIHARLDDLDDALACGERALQIAERGADVRLRILTTTYLAQTHSYRGEYARAVELSRANLTALPGDWGQEFFGGSQALSVNCHQWALMSLAQLGRFAEAAPHEVEILRLAEASRHAYTLGVAYHAAGVFRLMKGEWASAYEFIERELAALRTGSIVDEVPKALAISARALAYLGDADEALRRSRESERLLHARVERNRLVSAWPYYSLGRVYLLCHQPHEARSLAERAIDASSRRIDAVPDTLQLLGDIAIHGDRFDPERAEPSYRRALVLAAPRGMQPLVAHCHDGLGMLYARMGKREQATEHLATATAMYRDMGMAFWLEQATGRHMRLNPGAR